MSQEHPFSIFQQIPTMTRAKWLAFLLVVYALYDGVYIFADSKRLMLDIEDISSGLMPIVAMHIDVPLLIGGLLICLLFDRRRMLAALAIRGNGQLAWLAVGAVLFLVAVYFAEPASVVDIYEIVHAVIIAGLLEELIFRGLFFAWLDAAGCGWLAYFLSGLAWGAHYGIRAIVVSGTAALWAVLPMAIFGIVVGTIAAIIYKQTNSLWLVAYLHGALSLL